MYDDFMDGHNIYLQNYVWKLKIPQKIKIFMWFLHKKILLTKDNLAKRNWKSNSHCSFCGNDENIEQLFYFLPFCKTHLASSFLNL